MSAEFGRISGPLLASNLLRDGVDLAFETNLLYFNVTNGRIGIKTDSPTRDLLVNNTIGTTNIIVDTQADIANLTINANNIRNFTNSIYIRPDQTTNPEIYAVKYATDNIEFSTNLIKNTVTNSDLNISPVTGGQTNIRTGINVYGDLHSTGNITWDGDIQLGNSDSDNVVFSADVNSDIIPRNPGDVEMYNLGNNIDKRWNIAYVDIVNSSNFYPDTASIGTLTAGNIQITSNAISNIGLTDPINISPNGIGVARFNGTQYIDGSNIVNRIDNPLVLSNIGAGYVKFGGTAGLVMPFGTTDERPSTVEIGAFRYNTTLGYAEICASVTPSIVWQPARGTAVELNVDEITDVMEIWTLILG